MSTSTGVPRIVRLFFFVVLLWVEDFRFAAAFADANFGFEPARERVAFRRLARVLRFFLALIARVYHFWFDRFTQP
jgi:hypothetical protein